ncbi:MAG: UDP-N-acetylglucosamine pyrophosphorylase, partial [Clostridia bacterium]|nr:UDP-N-acetylglucosamine pyrophosphorylase [Clostridia bacterium]
MPYISGLFDKTYPWEILPGIRRHVEELIAAGIEGFVEIRPGVLVGRGVKIAETAVIEPPAVIGSDSEIRPGAYIRGSVITGPRCVIGNSTELKNCVLLRRVQVPHYNYVGDSILGNGSHLGAGAICSNLKSDGKNVIVRCCGEKYETGLRKVGSFIGDGADIGCGCVLNPGTVVGKRTSVYPLTPLRGVYPCGCIVKTQTEICQRV